MGEWYDFEIGEINGVEVSGFWCCGEMTKWQEVFVPMTDDQAIKVNEIHERIYNLEVEKNNLIKSFLNN